MRSLPVTSLLALALLGASASATDFLVGSGGFPTIGHAMDVARPGDRILVLPGDYPAFQFETGVSVHGLGDSPDDVRVARVDYHVSYPTIGYDTALTNLTVGNPTESALIAVSGNELPPGTFVMDGVEIQGGVFLEGGPQGFSLIISNTSIDPGPGQGFNGAAMTVGRPNNYIEIADSRIRGWDADPSTGHLAGVALRVEGGTTVRIVGSEVLGGGGAPQSGFTSGGDALAKGLFPGPVSLRVDGQTLVRGGAAAPGGAGGDGVDVSGATAWLGAATVQGGSGTPAGSAWGSSTPQALPVGTHLELLPAMTFGQPPAFVVTGELLTVQVHEHVAPAAITVAFDIDVPPPVFYSLAAPTSFFFGNTVGFVVPASPFAVDLPGILLFAQGFVLDPATGQVLVTNADVVRVDLLSEGARATP